MAAFEVPFGLEGLVGGVYLVIGQPERYVEWCRNYLDARSTHSRITRACLVIAAGVRWAQPRGNGRRRRPHRSRRSHGQSRMLSPLRCWPMASPSATPILTRALDALRRGLVIAQDSGNRSNESHFAGILWSSRGPNAAIRGRTGIPNAGDP